MDRKDFFNSLLKEGVELLADTRLGKALQEMADDRVLYRPQGAIPEGAFQEKCTGCDACMMACPHNIIMIEDLEKRLPLIYDPSPCLACEGQPCRAACTTGALRKT